MSKTIKPFKLIMALRLISACGECFCLAKMYRTMIKRNRNITHIFILALTATPGIFGASSSNSEMHTQEHAVSTLMESSFRQIVNDVMKDIKVTEDFEEEDLQKIRHHVDALPLASYIKDELFYRIAQRVAKECFLILPPYRYQLFGRDIRRYKPKYLPECLQLYFTGLSIQDLIRHKFLPRIDQPRRGTFSLALSGFHINDLTGLDQIPGIEHVTELWMEKNRLVTIPAHAFACLTNLRLLSLVSNKLTAIKPGMFGGLPHLEALSLHRNQITDFPSQAFENLPHLKYLSLYDNPIALESEERKRIDNVVKSSCKRCRITWQL